MHLEFFLSQEGFAQGLVRGNPACQQNFFGFEKTLLNIPGVPILLMSLSGCLLWIFHRARMRRAQLAPVSRETGLFPARSTGEPKEVPPLG